MYEWEVYSKIQSFSHFDKHGLKHGFFIELIPINLKPYKNHQPPRLKNAHSYHVAILVESQID